MLKLLKRIQEYEEWSTQTNISQLQSKRFRCNSKTIVPLCPINWFLYYSKPQTIKIFIKGIEKLQVDLLIGPCCSLGYSTCMKISTLARLPILKVNEKYLNRKFWDIDQLPQELHHSESTSLGLQDVWPVTDFAISDAFI